MNESQTEEPIQGEILSEDDVFWYEWWRESPKLNIALFRDLLGRLITLAAGLAGASAAFLDERFLHPGFRSLAIACFFVALTLACFGIVPRSEMIAPCLEDIQASKARALQRLKQFFLLSAIALGFGFGAILVGSLVKLL